MLSGGLTAPKDILMQTVMSRDVKFCLSSEDKHSLKNCVPKSVCICDANYDRSRLTCCNFLDYLNLHGFRYRPTRKLLCTDACGNCNFCTCSGGQFLWIPYYSLPNAIHTFIRSPRPPFLQIASLFKFFIPPPDVHVI